MQTKKTLGMEVKAKAARHLPKSGDEAVSIFAGMLIALVLMAVLLNAYYMIVGSLDRARATSEYFIYHEVVPVEPVVGNTITFMSVRTIKSYGRYESFEKIQRMQANGTLRNVVERASPYPINRPDKGTEQSRACKEPYNELYPTAECIEWTWKDSIGNELIYLQAGLYIAEFVVTNLDHNKSQAVTTTYEVLPRRLSQ